MSVKKDCPLSLTLRPRPGNYGAGRKKLDRYADCGKAGQHHADTSSHRRRSLDVFLRGSARRVLPAIAWLTAMLLAITCAIGSVGCGKSESSRVIARVDRATITIGTFRHWLHIVAARDYKLAPTRPLPSWVLPDPPRYRRCTAHLAAVSKPSSADSTPSYRATCVQQYQHLKEQTLNFLLTGTWFIQEGRARGIQESDREVRARVGRVIEQEFGGRAGFERDRKFIGETFADEMFRSSFKIYSEKMEAPFRAPDGTLSTRRARIFAAWVEAFPKRWASRTTCSPGYVVPNCREYKGSEKPQIQL